MSFHLTRALPPPQHKFWVVRSAGSDTYNYVNPPQRDVVSTGTTGDNVTIRFQTDNPGPWFLHCHIDFHLEAGFAIVLAEDTADVSTYNTPSSKFCSPPLPEGITTLITFAAQLLGTTCAPRTTPRTTSRRERSHYTMHEILDSEDLFISQGTLDIETHPSTLTI